MLRILKGSKVFFDTAPIIYHLEGHDSFGPLVRKLFDNDSGLILTTSVLSLMETTVVPFRNKQQDKVQQVSRFFKNGIFDELYIIDSEVAFFAAELRGRHSGLKAVDSLQLSVAIINGCSCFLTNDLRLPKMDEIDILFLSNLSAD